MNRSQTAVLKVSTIRAEVLIKRCRQIIDQPDFVRGLTNFYWWSELAA